MVEELVDGRAVINNPAGHLDEDESFADAVMREVREETGWEFAPECISGLYLWKSDRGRTFLRVNFLGSCTAHDPGRALDAGVLRARWMTRAELAAQPQRLRSPMVLRCIDDALAGKRFPLDLLTHIDGDERLV